MTSKMDPPSGDDNRPDRRAFFRKLGKWSLIVAGGVAAEETGRRTTRAAESEVPAVEDTYCDIAPGAYSDSIASWTNAGGSDEPWANSGGTDEPWANSGGWNDYSDAWSNYSDSWGAWHDAYHDIWSAWANWMNSW